MAEPRTERASCATWQVRDDGWVRVCTRPPQHDGDHDWKVIRRLTGTPPRAPLFKEGTDMANEPTIPEMLAQVQARLTQLERERETAYQDRDLALSLLARLAAASGWPVGVGPHEGADLGPRWRQVVFIETPAGQLSWHFPVEEAPLFASLPAHAKPWDGHTTEQKHARIREVNTEIDRLNAQLHGKG